MLEMEINANDDNLDVNIESQNETLESNIEVNTTLGTDNYKELKNKPKINDVELVDNKTSEELGLQPKGDYATKEYVEQEIAMFDFIKIVTELPETGLVNRTYFVPKTNTETNDLYDEYMWVDGKWELVGTKQIEVDLSDYVKNTDYATSSKGGIVKVKDTQGIGLTSTNYLMIQAAKSPSIKAGSNINQPIIPFTQHESVFYGLAKASGDTTQSASRNAVGTYTDEAKASIKSMLGIDLTNVVRDADYVHTDNNYTEEEKIKLSGLSNDYTQLNNLPKINGTLLTGNKTNSDLNIPMEYVDLSSDTKTLQEIGEGCYIVSKNGKINTANGYSRVIGKGTEIIIVRTNKSGIPTLCATFQDGANVYRIDDDASSAADIKPFLKRSDIDTELTESSTDKKVPSSKAVYEFVKEYVNNIIK